MIISSCLDWDLQDVRICKMRLRSAPRLAKLSFAKPPKIAKVLSSFVQGTKVKKETVNTLES